MQKNYVPDGWLGIILGSKIFVNFSKYPFEECMRRLKFELQNVLGEKSPANETKPVSDSNETDNFGGHGVPAGSTKEANRAKNWSRNVSRSSFSYIFKFN
jgi:hypothetical protein